MKCGPGFGGQSSRAKAGGRGEVFDPCAAHSLVRFVDPLHWLPQRPLSTPSCEDVGTGHVCSLAAIKVRSYFHKLTSDPAAFRGTTGRKKKLNYRFALRLDAALDPQITAEGSEQLSIVVLHLNSSK